MANDNIKKILSLMQADDSVDAPLDSIKWAKNVFRSRADASQTLVRRIFAALQMDIRIDEPILGERSAAAAKVRQVLFTAGDTAIDLRISAEKRGVAVRGQLLGEGLSRAAIGLASARNRYETESDENAEFTFQKVEAGNYSMAIEVADKRIEIENIQLP